VPEGEVPSTREQGLISLWEGLLGRFGIGLDDNFFELGGHSLLVVEMVSAIERDFEVPLAVTDVFESPTVRELARRLEQRGGAQAPPYQHLFPIQPRGRRRPFIVAVPHFFTEMLAERFRDERPVYGLRGVSLRPEGNRGRWRTLTALGEELVEEIVRRFPEESCIMAGYSFGASMAIEAVRIMEERRIPVHRLYLIAPMAQDFYRRGPFQVQLDGLRQPVAELSTAEALRLFALGNHPLTRRPYRRAWRWLAIEPWRRFLCLLGRLRRRVGQPLTPRILHADLRVERFRLHAGYRPGVVHTPTVVFNAREPATDAAATWRPYFQGPFTVHHTPDPHDHASVEAAREVILGHLEDLGD
jgi:acyl carrier protein/thioesterase domain-containing protein